MEVMTCRTVEAKSFASAAHALDVAPLVLSKVISALEADLRFTLFNRSTRRLSLTEAGSSYYERCRLVMRARVHLCGVPQSASFAGEGAHIPRFRACFTARQTAASRSAAPAR